MGREALPEVRDGLWDSPRGSVRVEGPSQRSRTGRGTLPVV